MARRGRPASESYQPICCSSNQLVSFSTEAGAVRLEDEVDHAPIFSLSKSSMDVVMATGRPQKRDPVWTRMDLKRSSSTNTHSEHNSVAFMQLPPHMLQHVPAANNHQLSSMAQNVDVHSHPALSERWMCNKQRWSQGSGSTHSRSSTPDTIVWRDRTSRPSSLTLETSNCAAPDSPMSTPNSTPTKTYPFISPIQTPTSTPENPLTSSLINLSTHQQEDFLLTHSLPPGSSPTPSPPLSPHQANSASPMQSISTSTEDECFLEKNLLSFTFPSPPPSSVSFAEESIPSDLGYLTDGVIEELHSPENAQLLEDGGIRSPAQMLSYLMPNSPAKEQEAGGPFCHLELPWQPEQSCLTRQSWRSPLVCSISDSQLGDCCRCVRVGLTKTPQGVTFKEEGTMTSSLDLVDAAVQTISPLGSLWGLMTNMSTSNMGSHSILGSPPGSRLNLKYSVGSHSNLVSPSSSMFPVSSGEEEERQGEDQICNSSSVPASSHNLERRRSCLKMQRDESDEMGRRGSMKQVQWDEDGMTWDIHGASPDLEVLSEAIRKHLEVQNSPRPARPSSKKKKAPKPPLLSNVVKAMTPELNPTVTITMPSCMVEDESEDAPEGGRKVREEGGERKQETEESDQRISRAEGDNIKEKEEVYGEEGTNNPKSPSRGSGQVLKKSVIRSLRRPGWCGGSRKADG